MEYKPLLREDGIMCAKLEIDETLIENYEGIKHLLVFPLKTYVKLKRWDETEEGADVWNITFASINAFMNSISSADSVGMAKTLILMHDSIKNFFNEDNIHQFPLLMKTLSVYLDTLDKEHNIMDQLREYIRHNVPIGLFEGAGKRAQDSDKLTFVPEEVLDLMTICLLCKILCPLFSAIMERSNKLIDNKSKELQCVSIFTDLVNRKYSALHVKLMNYITHTVKQTNPESLTSLAHGYSIASLAYHLYAQLLIRQFVNVDLTVKNGNLMVYIIVSAKRAISTIVSSIQKTPLYTRKPMMSKHEDDGNASQIEIDSLTTRKTSDCLSLIEAAIPGTLSRYRNLYQIQEQEYNKVANFYMLGHRVLPTTINKAMNSTFYSSDFGGGRGLLMLKANEYTQITALLQMVLISLDVNYIELAHTLTMLPAIGARAEATMNDSKFKLNAGSSPAYRKCKLRFENSPYGQRGKEWDIHVAQITEELITKSYVYNTASWLWEFLGEENLNGKIFEPSENTITALCCFNDWLYELNTGIVHD